MSLVATHRAHLDDLNGRGRLRSLLPRSGIDFSSNDYLGLASSSRLSAAVEDALAHGVPIGSGGSRLLRGNHPEHEALEAEAATFFGAESALYFSSGYTANAAQLSTLPQRGDLVIHDALIHASAHEGLRLGRAVVASAAHNDPQGFEDAIVAWRKAGGVGTPWIAVESLYSMDGDRAPLSDLVKLATAHDGFLLIDEAHATGVFGTSGRGLAEGLDGLDNVVTLRTCGKALGCEGALLCCSHTLRDFLVNRARGFIFSTAPSPLMASAVREALRIIADESERRDRLWALVAVAERALRQSGVTSTGSQILPLVIGDDVATMRLAAAVQAAGFDVRGIRPPTVPMGTSRLRISLTLNASPADIESLAGVLMEALG
jgi:8-amino-7-oxononanoate synthase